MRKFTAENAMQLLKSKSQIETELLLIKADKHGFHESDIPTIVREKQIDLERQLQRIESLFAILTEDEGFVIRRHIMDGLDWFRIIKEHTDIWGQESEKSVRSYQINQSNALKKIARLINEREESELFYGMIRKI